MVHNTLEYKLLFFSLQKLSAMNVIFMFNSSVNEQQNLDGRCTLTRFSILIMYMVLYNNIIGTTDPQKQHDKMANEALPKRDGS